MCIICALAINMRYIAKSYFCDINTLLCYMLAYNRVIAVNMQNMLNLSHTYKINPYACTFKLSLEKFGACCLSPHLLLDSNDHTIIAIGTTGQNFVFPCFEG